MGPAPANGKKIPAPTIGTNTIATRTQRSRLRTSRISEWTDVLSTPAVGPIWPCRLHPDASANGGKAAILLLRAWLGESEQPNPLGEDEAGALPQRISLGGQNTAYVVHSSRVRASSLRKGALFHAPSMQQPWQAIVALDAARLVINSVVLVALPGELLLDGPRPSPHGRIFD